jgi:hypothetical protein
MRRRGALVVSSGRIHEVDDDAGLLARVHSHDAPDPLLVDAAAGGRRKMHADGRAW